jgi:hypothetical protein
MGITPIIFKDRNTTKKAFFQFLLLLKIGNHCENTFIKYVCEKK